MLIRSNPYFTAQTAYYGVDIYSFNKDKTWTAMMQDVSTVPASYQTLELHLTGGTELLSGGTVNLPYGEYKMSWYPINSGGTLAQIDRTQLLMVDHAYVSGRTDVLSATTYDNGSSDEVFVYNNN